MPRERPKKCQKDQTKQKQNKKTTPPPKKKTLAIARPLQSFFFLLFTAASAAYESTRAWGLQLPAYATAMAIPDP